jgi:hypothetical protein
MRNIIKKILKEDFDWTQDADVTWSTYFNEIYQDIQNLPDNVEDVTVDMLMPTYYKLDVLTRQYGDASDLSSDVRYQTNEVLFTFNHIIKNVSGELHEPDQDLYSSMKNYLLHDLPEIINELRSLNEDFDWTSQVDITPNYQGHPQGVVHLRSHDEIKEFFDLIGSSYGIVGKRKNELEKTKRDFHNAFDETIDRFEGPDWGGHSDWIPTISASFFISKQDPTKYDTGYWDYDVEEDSVEDWLTNEGCEHEVIDCENWKIYTDISQLRTLFNDYTGEVLHKTKSGKPIKVGDKVKVIDPDSDQYGEVLEVEHLVGGDGYEKHGGAFQTIEFDTLYFAGHEVEHIEDLNEDFDWTKNVPDPGKYDLYDIQGLIMTGGINIGDNIHLKGHARDIDMVFDNVGTVSDVMEINNKYLDGEDELEYAIRIRFKEDILHGKGYDGMDIPEYELNDGFADQEDLTFDIVKNINEDFDWAEDVSSEIPQDWNHRVYYIYEDDEGYGFMEEHEFLEAPQHRFSCRNYYECPQSVGGDIYLSYPDKVRISTGFTTREVWADKVVYEFGDELIDDFKSGKDVGGRYVWDESEKWFYKIDNINESFEWTELAEIDPVHVVNLIILKIINSYY